jgi:hypothetical protein
MRSLFTLFLALLSTSLLAQYQIQAVTLTDRSDKVSTGYIRYYDWDKNPKSVEFSEDSLGQMKSLPLRNIQKLDIKNIALYEGLYLAVPYYFKSPVRLGEPIIQHTDSTYYLAELLLDSEAIKLYRFFDNDKQLRFAISKYDSLILLENIQTSVIRKDKVYNYEEAVYRKTLKAALAECPTLNTDNTAYSESSLISLLKQYLSFCRIDSRIYLEQRQFSKVIFGLGAYTSFWGDGQENSLHYGLSLQLLLNRHLHNFFIIVDLGGITRKEYSLTESNLQLGLYGGRYVGRHAIQGKFYTGISTTLGPLDTGLGLSYRKMVSVEMRYPVFVALVNGFQGFGATSYYIPPLFNLRAVFPLGHASH